jgi:hypothetical protein
MSTLFGSNYYKINENGISPFQNTLAYLGGSAIQTIVDNPVTAYRQLVQQYAKDSAGKVVSPKTAVREANQVFLKTPINSSLSGLKPRLVGVLFKRIPKFGFLLGYDYISGGTGEPGVAAATTASILSAPFINPIRMIEKQQRGALRQYGIEKPITEILRESQGQNFRPLFRGTVPLMGHSLASALLGLVGQPKLQKHIQTKLGDDYSFSRTTSNLISSSVVSPIYVAATNPLSRLEVIMQTSSIQGKSITVTKALSELSTDMAKFGMAGIFRGQGIGIFKAIISLSLFHEGRLFMTDQFKSYNRHVEQ